MADQSKFKSTFVDEVSELLRSWEGCLYRLTDNADADNSSINELFRILHAIKAASAMFDFPDISSFSAEIENLVDLVRVRKLVISPLVRQLLQDANRQIAQLLIGDPAIQANLVVSSDRLIATSRALQVPVLEKPLAQVNPGITELVATGPAQQRPESEPQKKYRIRLIPGADNLEIPVRALAVVSSLQQVSDSWQIKLRIDKLPSLDSLNTQTCYLYWDIWLLSHLTTTAIGDLFQSAGYQVIVKLVAAQNFDYEMSPVPSFVAGNA
jgi:chemotaxis protein histidine kinase CheA